jgi:hypothetical protein
MPATRYSLDVAEVPARSPFKAQKTHRADGGMQTASHINMLWSERFAFMASICKSNSIIKSVIGTGVGWCWWWRRRRVKSECVLEIAENFIKLFSASGMVEKAHSSAHLACSITTCYDLFISPRLNYFPEAEIESWWRRRKKSSKNSAYSSGQTIKLPACGFLTSLLFSSTVCHKNLCRPPFVRFHDVWNSVDTDFCILHWDGIKSLQKARCAKVFMAVWSSARKQRREQFSKPCSDVWSTKHKVNEVLIEARTWKLLKLLLQVLGFTTSIQKWRRTK